MLLDVVFVVLLVGCWFGCMVVFNLVLVVVLLLEGWLLFVDYLILNEVEVVVLIGLLVCDLVEVEVVVWVL